MHVQWVEVYLKACCIATTSPSLAWKNKVIGGNQSRVQHWLISLCCRRVCRCVFLSQLTVHVMLKLFVCVSTLGWRIPPPRRFQRRWSASSWERWDLHVGLFQYVMVTFVTLLLRRLKTCQHMAFDYNSKLGSDECSVFHRYLTGLALFYFEDFPSLFSK